MKYSDQDLLDEIHRLADELGHPPTLKEMRTQGKHSVSKYYERFGSWRESLREPGFEPRKPDTEIPEEELLKEIHCLEAEIGDTPSARQMDENGEYWASTYRNQFGSWSAALEAAGFEPPDPSIISKTDLIDELHSLEEELGHKPTMREMRSAREYGERTYVRRFGSRSAALKEAFDTSKNDDK